MTPDNGDSGGFRQFAALKLTPGKVREKPGFAVFFYVQVRYTGLYWQSVSMTPAEMRFPRVFRFLDVWLTPELTPDRLWAVEVTPARPRTERVSDNHLSRLRR